MGISFDIRKRKSGKLYLQFWINGRKQETKIESKDEGIILSKHFIDLYFKENSIPQDKRKTHGFVYIASNDNLRTLKIGKSKNNPKHRLKDMSIGLPSPFKLEHFIEVEDVSEAEHIVHNSLSDHRVFGTQEVFDVSVEEAKKELDWAEMFVNRRYKALKMDMQKFGY